MRNPAYLLLYLTLLLSSCGKSLPRQEYYGIIPKPVSANFRDGAFKLTPNTKICLLSNDSKLLFSSSFFNSIVEKSFGTKLEVISSASPVEGALNISLNLALKEEGYHLTVSTTSIQIEGGSPKGIFYAFQSLRQLLPAAVLFGEQANRIEIPKSEITDEPFFGYRGAMLDVGRYYFNTDQVKEFIDVLAMHKINTFHWHLTEDYGWRIEIKKYPNLTQIGSVREKSPYKMIRGKPIQYDNKSHGGFYTQEEVKEIVRYAAERFITVIPEIELPGHATAALASYPHLGCKGKDYKVETTWKVTDEAFCAGRESTFEFLDDVFSEIATLFPSEYIHIGGDECRKTRWKNCPDCQKRIRQEKLKDEPELQSYFVKRVEKILRAKGKKIIGWDEILEGGVSPTATVMSWRGVDGGIEAAQKGNQVIMSPSTHFYLDFYQSKDTKTEPLSIGGYTPVDTVYAFDPFKGLNQSESRNILGVQANIWTAFMETTDIIYYMTLPRLAAVAEVGWSYHNTTPDYPEFKKRMGAFRNLYDAKGLPYAKYMFEEFSVYHLTCEQAINPVAIETETPRFSWRISAEKRNFSQSAYQILVADSPEKLANNTGNIWDSKRTADTTSLFVPYKGKKLISQKKYYWKVKVWDNSGTPSDWSMSNTFSPGLLSQTDWGQAKWIALEPDKTDELIPVGLTGGNIAKRFGNKKTGMYNLPLFRKEFTVKKDLKQATVYVSGLGHFDMFLNNEKVGDHFLDPGWTKYDKNALYVAFDISNRLRYGDNALGVMLGNGFFNIPRERYLKMLTSYGAPKMILKIRLDYKDGSTEEIVTDSSWKASPGPITFSSIYGGEDYDANAEQTGWAKTGFDDRRWQDVQLPDWSTRLALQQTDPLKVRNRLSPVRTFRTEQGDWVYDLGQNFSGIIRVQVKATPGQTIRFHPAELLNPDKSINQSASGRPFYFSYTAKGDSAESWQPQFTYYGFRYVQLEGAVPAGQPNPGNLPEVVTLAGLHTSNSAEEVGSFDCSNEMFNRIYHLIDWSVRSNLASVLTDCPHREKLGWLEVAHLMFNSIQYRYDVARFYGKVMNDMRSTQAENGQIATTAPELVEFSKAFKDTPEWGSAFIIIPWYVYQCYGDKQLITEYYTDMQRYIDYLSSKASNYIISYGLGDWFDIGPANPGESQLTSKGVTATAIYYYNVCIMQKMAGLLGETADVSSYAALAAQIKQSFNDTFWDQATQKYDRDSQAANAMALYMGLVEETNKTKIFDNLVRDIRNRGNALTAGDVGYRYVLRTLEANEASDVIYDMNSKENVPGYGWQLAHGATALTESWQAYGFVSNNHCMLGHLMEWLFIGLGGIRQQEGSIAWKQIRIKPDPAGDIREALASYQSPYGIIESHWKKDNNVYEHTVTVPPNSRASVYLPGTDITKISESGVPLEKVPGITIIGRKKNSIVIQIGSGNYHFCIPL